MNIICPKCNYESSDEAKVTLSQYGNQYCFKLIWTCAHCNFHHSIKLASTERYYRDVEWWK